MANLQKVKAADLVLHLVVEATMLVQEEVTLALGEAETVPMPAEVELVKGKHRVQMPQEVTVEVEETLVMELQVAIRLLLEQKAAIVLEEVMMAPEKVAAQQLGTLIRVRTV